MTAADTAALPVTAMTTVNNIPYLTLSYRQYALATGITINVQTSADLKSWQTVTPDSSQTTGTDPVTGDPLIEDQVSAANSTRKFIRLNVTMP